MGIEGIQPEEHDQPLSPKNKNQTAIKQIPQPTRLQETPHSDQVHSPFTIKSNRQD